MMGQMKQVVLTDCDGVLLNWDGPFDEWLVQRRGFKAPSSFGSASGSRPSQQSGRVLSNYHLSDKEIDELVFSFNDTANVGFLPPFRDAAHVVKKLHAEHGFVFRVITNIGTNHYSKMLREKNLRSVFGSAIDTVTCLPIRSDKRDALEQYKDTGLVWVEDNVKHATLGLHLGLKSILMDHGKHAGMSVMIPVAKNWQQIASVLVD